MLVIMARNVNDALAQAVKIIASGARPIEVRGRFTMEVPEPVSTVYRRPTERVLFDEARDANPFFHVMEALWMLAGRDDVEWISTFLPRMADFSDGGESFHGAYGFRLRTHFDVDQFDEVVSLLRADPNTRRAVLQIWDAAADLLTESRDLPCNTTIYLKHRHGVLNMTVCCRSNDAMWGCYGSNAVHFSFILEYLAARLGWQVGRYTHVSDSLHVYPDSAAWMAVTAPPMMPGRRDLYVADNLVPLPLVDEPEAWDEECARFIDMALGGEGPKAWRNRWIGAVAVPMATAHRAYRADDLTAALEEAGRIAADDWRTVCTEWLERRITRRRRRFQDATQLG